MSKHRSVDDQEAKIRKFRRSFMNTPIYEVGVRLKIVYLAQAKHWKMRECDGPWRKKAKARCTTQVSECDIARGFYIRVESGMSERIHKRILIKLYRQRYTPDHPLWQDTLFHGTLQEFTVSLKRIGLVCGGLAKLEESKRSEIHLVKQITNTSGKTPGVKSGSNLIVQLNARKMNDDGIELYISEEVPVVFTRGAACSSKDKSVRDVVDFKYFTGMTTAQGKELMEKILMEREEPPRVEQREPPRKRMPSNENERSQRAASGPSRVELQSAGFPASASSTTFVARQKQIIEDKTAGAVFSLFGSLPQRSVSLAAAAVPNKSPPASIAPSLGEDARWSRHKKERAEKLRTSQERGASSADHEEPVPVAVKAVPYTVLHGDGSTMVAAVPAGTALQNSSDDAKPVLAAPYKEPPKSLRTANLSVGSKSKEEDPVAMEDGEISGPWSTLQAPVSIVKELATSSMRVHPKTIPPPPPYPAAEGVGLPAGKELPRSGTRAASQELEKVGDWERESRPSGQGIVNPQPLQAEIDFRKLIMKHLMLRGLDETVMKYKGLHNGWQEFKLICPLIMSDGA